MREKKFRGKRKDNGEWVYGSLIQAADGTFILEIDTYDISFQEPEYHTQGMGCGLEDRQITDIYDAMFHGWERGISRVADNWPDFIEVHPETVGQYIGRKDKNGIRWCGDEIITNSFQNLIIRYFHNSCKWCAGMPKQNFWLDAEEALTQGYWSIGNIHDNPELMKGK
ncbi:MAG: hypothetical protein KAS32_10545 [Candidatus Peribacteraceae bacterium]|nr:hypothetical protein [Candidatus Peribacteraceae bacterium]